MISNEETQANVAANLTRLLAERGWTQIQLVRVTGEDPMTISRAVRGQSTPGTAAMARIAEAFDVSIDRLVASPSRQTHRKSEAITKTQLDS